jgi:hypothetical protein
MAMRGVWIAGLACGVALGCLGLAARAEDGAGPPPPPAPVEPVDPKAPVVPEPPPELITDRPDFTESSRAAPRGYAQFEYGLDYRAGEDAQGFSLPLLLVRYGLGGGGEVRVGFTGLELTFPRDGPGETDVGPLSLGGKYAFSLGPSLDLSLIGMLGLPLRGDAYDSEGVSLTFKLTAALELADWVSLGANFGVDVLGLGASSSAQDRVYLASLVLGFEATERTYLFLEGYGEIPERVPDEARAVLQAGFAYQPAPHWQVDGYLGMDLRDAPHAVVAGLGGAVLW